ncbi:unnamed protein product [Meloidogyne enterolobii]|uniref:Uncharacterized protein n=1 Tax=Meloidogyne enterolobii TaxID=390850 RepID=A0ACB0YY18_MELEN
MYVFLRLIFLLFFSASEWFLLFFMLIFADRPIFAVTVYFFIFNSSPFIYHI